MVTSTKIKDFLQSCNELTVNISNQEKPLVKLLTQYETHEAALDEIKRSRDTLRGLRKEISAIHKPLDNIDIATFFPLNLPLYSLILFAIAPSAFAKRVYIRPSEVMNEILGKLWALLSISSLFPDLELKPVPRHIFLDLYARESDIIIFTGKYENAFAIKKYCPETLLIYNGSGVNPFLLFADADIDLAVEKAVEMRCFNSGQDCAGPDAFFVPSEEADIFIDKLQKKLSDIKVGDTADPAVKVGRIIRSSYVYELQEWLEHEKKYIVYGGEIDAKKSLVYPTIVRKQINDHKAEHFHEFFAPFFYVLEYKNVQQLEKILLSKEFKERGMYVSVFGNNNSVEHKLDYVQVLKNQIVNDVEKGNLQYGGYGSHANFLLVGNKKVVQPILISRDIHQLLSR